MTENDLLIAKWIDLVAAVQFIEMDPDALVDDVLLMSMVFGDDFEMAMAAVVNALTFIVQGRVSPSHLVHNLRNWTSFHFQSQRALGNPADLRIVYQSRDTSVRVRGFGHRHLPDDFYRRLYARPSEIR
jgi:hypothetical protein